LMLVEGHTIFKLISGHFLVDLAQVIIAGLY
jgi:hypothetical protein